MIENIEKVIREYIPNVIHMSLATSENNKPWVCEVHYAFDDNLNLYFRSRPATRHSVDIRNNKFVAGNIVEQHGPTDKPRGIYFEGTCEELSDVKSEDQAYIQYSKRFNTSDSILTEQKEENGHKFYKVSVEKFYVFDSRESKPSQMYKLEWNK